MAAVSEQQRHAFFQQVKTADSRAATKIATIPSLASVTPVIKPEQSGNLEHRQKTYQALFRKRTLLELHAESRLKQLYQLNPIIFYYLNEQQKKALIEDLEDTRDLLNRIVYMEAVEDHHIRLAELDKDAQTCQHFIDWIRTGAKPKRGFAIPEPNVPSWAKGLIGSNLLFPIYQRIQALKENPIDIPLNAMNDINNLRLYWVWGNSLLDILFTLCKEFDLINLDIFNKLENELQWPAPITGNLSWILYYVRFLLRIYVCLRPILPGISEEQKGVSNFEKLLATINQHKFSLLNDMLWGTVNLACYAWLTYRKNTSLGYAGDLLTAGFLIMDLILNFLDYMENMKTYYQNCNSLEEEIEHLEILLQGINDEKEKNIIRLKLVNAKQRLSDYQFDFVYKNMELINGCVYATLLMLSFPLLIGMISAPASLPISAGIILTGALLCFAFTVLFQAVDNLIPVIKANSQRSRLIKHHKQLFDLLQQAEDVNQQKIIMIQMDDMQQKIDYKKQQTMFQCTLFLRSLTIDILFPVLVFVALFSFPIGAGIGMITAGFALAIASKWLINGYEPIEPDKIDYTNEQLALRLKEVWQQKQPDKFTSVAKKPNKEQAEDKQGTPNTGESFQAALFCPA